MKRSLLLMLLGFGLVRPAAAMDSIAVEYGNGDRTDMGRVDLVWQWDKKWFTEGHWHLTGYWEGRFGYWDSQETGGKSVWDVGFAPVFRLRPNASGGVQPYLEGSIGVHLLSRTGLAPTRDMSSAFQFAEHVGLGVTFGNKSQYDLGYRLQHLSNGGIKQPNPGITFQQVRLSRVF